MTNRQRVAWMSPTRAANASGKSSIASVPNKPSPRKVHSPTRNTLRTCWSRPMASASEMRRESATGTPAVAMVRKTLYIL